MIESLTASVVLLLAVVAASMALHAGRQHTLESEDQLQAALAAEAKLSQILADDYLNMKEYNGDDEPPGAMVTTNGTSYPNEAYRIGRRVTVEDHQQKFPGLGVVIDGLQITVTAYDQDERRVCTLTRFVPKPSQ
ncbi:MAG: hypothetical protein D8M59_05160 [Planctomycetes bacterium]|nr:hypothetical protein [Planctomycetota bacterium]NOG56030.1 hypothetical protein [Planctomycetota bacterium]